MKKKLIAGLVVLAGIVLYLNPFSSNGDGSIEVSTMKMERKDLSSKVVADGELPVSYTHLTLPTSDLV